MDLWCCRCERDRAFREDGADSCPIVAATMAYRVSDPEYPKEWRKDGPSGPRCTAFVAANNGDKPLDPAAAVRDLFAELAA